MFFNITIQNLVESLRTSLSEDQQDIELAPEYPTAASIYPDELMGSVDIDIKDDVDDEAIYSRSRH